MPGQARILAKMFFDYRNHSGARSFKFAPDFDGKMG